MTTAQRILERLRQAGPQGLLCGDIELAIGTHRWILKQALRAGSRGLTDDEINAALWQEVGEALDLLMEQGRIQRLSSGFYVAVTVQ
jgi:hypothetical protein